MGVLRRDLQEVIDGGLWILLSSVYVNVCCSANFFIANPPNFAASALNAFVYATCITIFPLMAACLPFLDAPNDCFPSHLQYCR
jgi:hypothetical protein